MSYGEIILWMTQIVVVLLFLLVIIIIIKHILSQLGIHWGEQPVPLQQQQTPPPYQSNGYEQEPWATKR